MGNETIDKVNRIIRFALNEEIVLTHFEALEMRDLLETCSIKQLALIETLIGTA